MATPGSSFTPTPIGHEENAGEVHLLHCPFPLKTVYAICKDLLPAPGNRLNETQEIERRTWQREERGGRNDGEEESGSEKEVVGKKKIRLDDVL
ncbi:hypothetical protein TNCV_3715611 [Trichonephila clavipes]|nr:hypothetical protein TNCV_3715611 [Trichonephila clavipes]